MGVTYKLEPKVRGFILEKKKADINLSCRILTALILENFQTKVSKSSINKVIKAAGLSAPVGRRVTKRHRRKLILPVASAIIEPPAALLPTVTESKAIEPVVLQPPPVEKPPEEPAPIEKPLVKAPAEEAKTAVSPSETEFANLGTILLKAADYLLGGVHYFSEAIKNRIGPKVSDIPLKTEALLYNQLKSGSWIKALDAMSPNPEDILSYLTELQQVETIYLDMAQILRRFFQEVRCLKVSFIGGSNLFLDGQLHTIWPTPYTPYDFSASIYIAVSYVNRYFQQNSPLIFFMAPGSDVPAPEFLDLIQGLNGAGKRISGISLIGNNFEELQAIPLERNIRSFFIFGLWPWQFSSYRKITKLGEFRPFTFEPLKESLYLADIDLYLTQPNTNKIVTLRGCALKRALTDKAKLVILSNLPAEKTAEELANLYLSRWPNMEEALGDHNRKAELFTYTAGTENFFSTESVALRANVKEDIPSLLENYLKILDAYLRRHILPAGYEKSDFSTTNKRFYSLPGRLCLEAGNAFFVLKPAPGYTFLKDLQYACRRINEREVFLSDGKRLWLKT